MNRRRTFRSIPPWWAEPIVFIPISTFLGILAALVAVSIVLNVGRAS